MPNQEEHVEFVAREGVTIYTGHGKTARAAGTAVSLPQSHAEELAHLSAEQPESE
jgi:hypothetical protein